jgi:signal transduction histidine kinase
MDRLAEEVQGLLQVPFVVVFSAVATDGIGIHFKRVPVGAPINREKFVEWVQGQAQTNDRTPKSGSSMPFPLHNFRNDFFLPNFEGIQNIAYIPLFDPLTPSALSLGGLIIGTAQPLEKDEEVQVLWLAQLLVGLARISALQNEVYLRSQFLSIASHELKTPLTSIYGILQLQERMLRLKADQRPFPDQERHHSFLKMVIRQVEKLNELIDGLLDVSRIQNGRFTIEPTDVDVAQLLKESTQSRLSLIAKEAGVILQLESVEHLQAKVDPLRMEEVINNLIMNAIRFSPDGGVVGVRLRDEDGAFRLTVRDQGPSIPIEDQERIFRPFERAQRTARMGGLGLGLFISRQIAQLHGGNVSLVESMPGRGNVFESYFPMSS